MADRHCGRHNSGKLTLPTLLLVLLLAAGVLSGCGTHSEGCSPRSEGRRQALVPDVWGRNLETARVLLCNEGFPSVVAHQSRGREPTRDESQWIVAQQDPAPGRRLPLGRQVRLVVIPNPEASTPTTDPLDNLTPEQEAAFNDFVNPRPTATPSVAASSGPDPNGPMRDFWIETGDSYGLGPAYADAFDGGYSLCYENSPEDLVSRYGVNDPDLTAVRAAVEAVEAEFESRAASSSIERVRLLASDFGSAAYDGCTSGQIAAGYG